MIRLEEIRPWMNWLLYPGVSVELTAEAGQNHTPEDYRMAWHADIWQLDLSAMAGKWQIVISYSVDGWTSNDPPCYGWILGGQTADENWGWDDAKGMEADRGCIQKTANTRVYYFVADILPTCHFERCTMLYYRTWLPTPRPTIYNLGFFFVRKGDTFRPPFNRDALFGDHGRYTFHCELVEQTNRGITERSLQFGIYEGWRCLPTNVSGKLTVNGVATSFYQAFHPWKVIPLPPFAPTDPAYTTEKVTISLTGVRCEVSGIETLVDTNTTWVRYGNEEAGTVEKTVNYTGEDNCADAWLKCYSNGTLIIAPARLCGEAWESGGGSLSFTIPAPRGDRSVLKKMAAGNHWAIMAKGRSLDFFTADTWEFAKVSVTSSDVDEDTNEIEVEVERWT